MRIRLTRRLALCIDGVSLLDHVVGDVFDLTRHEAELLVAEGWAVQVPDEQRRAEDRIRDALHDETAKIINAHDEM